MILSSLSDNFHVNITFRIRTIFFFYAIVSMAASIYVWVTTSGATSWDWVYRILFPISVLACLIMMFKPKIGAGSIYLFPIFIGSMIRVIDIWKNYFQGEIDLPLATLGSIGWSFLLVSISYIDLLESRIYHRLVNYIDEQQAD